MRVHREAAVVGDVGRLGAQGETVPRRGVTTISVPSPAGAGERLAVAQQGREPVVLGCVRARASLQTTVHVAGARSPSMRGVDSLQAGQQCAGRGSR